MSPASFTPVTEAVSLINVFVQLLRSTFESFKLNLEQLAFPPNLFALTETWMLRQNDALRIASYWLFISAVHDLMRETQCIPMKDSLVFVSISSSTLKIMSLNQTPTNA